MVATDVPGGTRSYCHSSLPLRPPLPPVKPAFCSIFGAPNTTENEREDNDKPRNDGLSMNRLGTAPTEEPEPKTPNISPSQDRSTSLSHSPSLSFLFRMYVACQVLRLGMETRFTALVLLHRYAQAKRERSRRTDCNSNGTGCTNDSGKSGEDWPWIGAVSIFLACKAEDEPRRLRDVINLAQMVLSAPPLPSTTEAGAGTGTAKSNGEECTGKPKSNDQGFVTMNLSRPPPLDNVYWDSKKKAIETEQMVLQWLGFDCSVSHPHRAVFWILRNETATQPTKSETGGNCHRKYSSEEWPGESHKKRHPNRAQQALTMTIAPHKRKHDESTSWREPDDMTTINHGNGVGDKILPLAFTRLNDALFYPKALRWGVVELACAAIDLAKQDVIQRNGDGAAGTNIAMALSTADTTAVNTSSSTNVTGSVLESIFKREWWQRYEVSNEHFDGCKNDLNEAMRALDAATASRPNKALTCTSSFAIGTVQTKETT